MSQQLHGWHKQSKNLNTTRREKLKSGISKYDSEYDEKV